MAFLRKNPNPYRDVISVPFSNASVTATTAAAYIWSCPAGQKWIVKGVQYHNVTGLATHADNWFVLSIQNGATVCADWSTDTGEEGSIAAATTVEFTNAATADDRIVDSGETLTLVLTEGGTATLPAGSGHVVLERVS
jgi:hypothetical protein